MNMNKFKEGAKPKDLQLNTSESREVFPLAEPISDPSMIKLDEFNFPADTQSLRDDFNEYRSMVGDSF